MATLRSDVRRRRGRERPSTRWWSSTARCPTDELYFDLLDASINHGEVDHAALLAVRPQAVQRQPGRQFQLFRIGDAVASRNIHAAVYDAFRLCLVL